MGAGPMLDAFYGAFSPACLTLLGLWLVAVQMRSDEVRGQRGTEAPGLRPVALFFALPGLISVIALIDTGDPLFWRVSFAVIALVGAAVLYPAHGLPGGRRVRNTADIVALFLYLAIAALALVGGTDEERTEAMLLTALIFVGFNVAWLFLFGPLEAKARHEPQGSPGAPAPR